MQTKPLHCAIGIFGGTFNPIHLGHLNLAETLLQQFNFQELRLLPTGIPPHKACTTSSADRVAMTRLAILGKAKLLLDEREIKRQGTSYTIDSLKDFRNEFGGKASLSFIMGMDSFNNFHTWKEWQQIPLYANLIVCKREHLSANNQEVLAKLKVTADPNKIIENSNGYVYFLDTHSLNISSTAIRAAIKEQNHIAQLVPPLVLAYIKQHNLYQD